MNNQLDNKFKKLIDRIIQIILSLNEHKYEASMYLYNYFKTSKWITDDFFVSLDKINE